MPKEGFARALFLLLTVFVLSGPGHASQGVSQRALETVRRLSAARMGVDAQDNLWTWQTKTGAVEFYSHLGEQIASFTIPDARGLDVDKRWGVAAVLHGNVLQIADLKGRPQKSIPLPNDSGSVTWIDQHRVAVAPRYADHRVELWDVGGAGRLLSTLGDEESIPAGDVGARLSRPVLLDYDDASERLYTLQSFSGDFKVFSLNGELLKQEQLKNPRREEFEGWISSLDFEARLNRESKNPAIWYFKLALDEEGNAWTVRECGAATASVVSIPMNGSVRQHELDVTCCGLGITVWDDQLVLYKNPGIEGPPCTSVRRLP